MVLTHFALGSRRVVEGVAVRVAIGAVGATGRVAALSASPSAILACSTVLDVDVLLLAVSEADGVDLRLVELLERKAE